MKKIFVFASILVTLILGACSGNESKGYDDSLPSATSTKPVTPVTIADTLLSDTTTTRTTAATQAVTKTTTISNTTTSARAGLNPAHGLAGHRCDIAVGASLSTPVSAASQQVKPTTINTTPAQGSSSPTSNASFTGKLNPPHGQPGHDCAVQVGQPLKN